MSALRVDYSGASEEAVPQRGAWSRAGSVGALGRVEAPSARRTRESPVAYCLFRQNLSKRAGR